MNVEARIKWTFYISFVLMLPAASNAWAGHIDPFDLMRYYLAAFLVAWIGVGILNRVIVWLAFDAARNQIERSMQRNRPRRRRTDPSKADTIGSSTSPRRSTSDAPELVETSEQ